MRSGQRGEGADTALADRGQSAALGSPPSAIALATASASASDEATLYPVPGCIRPPRPPKRRTPSGERVLRAFDRKTDSLDRCVVGDSAAPIVKSVAQSRFEFAQPQRRPADEAGLLEENSLVIEWDRIEERRGVGVGGAVVCSPVHEPGFATTKNRIGQSAVDDHSEGGLLGGCHRQFGTPGVDDDGSCQLRSRPRTGLR